MPNEMPELYASAHFLLELDGINTATVKSVEGGQAKTEVITYHANAQKGAQYRQAGKRKYEDLKIVFAVATQPEVWNWMKTFLAGDCDRKNGAVVAADYDYKERARRTFKDAVIAAIDFPKFDAKDKSPATVTLTISPEEVSYTPPKVDGAPIGDPGGRDQQKFIKSSNFDLVFDKIPTSATARVTKVDGFSLKSKIIEYHASGLLAPMKLSGKLEMPTIAFYVPEPDSGPFVDLMNKQMAGLQHDRHSATLTYYDNAAKAKGTFTFVDCTILSAASEKHDAGNEEVRQVKVEMAIESLKVETK
ncbi:MAG: phage tail protein [Kofleriaceae bacterium]|nr:phage tail protein [Kofleriaceae bacterium]MBP9169154.1 phage tail protein [Kofleriaceae bacterium]MBP9857847.1 phage tail protein [Kofleriaceae bacterium]